MKKLSKQLNNISKTCKAPFPYFGGKSVIAPFVWMLFGDDIKRYIEPFAGSLAVLLARKRVIGKTNLNIANDLDCLIINAWRALKYAPEKLAYMCLDPLSHLLLWQRVCYISKQKDYLLKKMLVNDSYFDLKLAAYWLYVKATEIGVIDMNKVDVSKVYKNIDSGIINSRPQLSASPGIHGYGKKSNTVGDYDTKRKIDRLLVWFKELQAVLEDTRFMCGDWSRLFTEKSHWQDCKGTRNLAIFFDPPYSDKERKASIYRLDSFSVAKDVNAFCVKNASKKTYRIVIAGFEGEHNNLEKLGFTKYKWDTSGGYSNLSSKKYANEGKERLWASNNCFNIDLKGKTINEYLKNRKCKL